MGQGKKVANNVVMLYIMNITQLILPLITLPYLTRVLSVPAYGVVSYTKNVMIYITLIIEFGFLLSGTREVAEANSKEKIERILGNVIFAKLILAIISFVILIIMIFCIKILKRYFLFTILMFIPQFLSIFLFDFFFRGIEKMQIITIRFLIMRGIATILTFFVIKSDSDLLYIPMLDIIGTFFAMIWILFEFKKLNIKIKFSSLREVLHTLRISFTYFVSSITTTAFSAFNTIIVGVLMAPKKVAYWTLLMSLVIGVQQLYSPISDGIYPRMIKTKSIGLFKKILLFFSPFLVLGCAFTYLFAKYIVLIIAGYKYLSMYTLLQLAVPLLFVSFYSILCGWPLLGSIGKVKETTFTTIIAAFSQVIGVIILVCFHIFNLYSLVILRIITESILALTRIRYFVRFRDEYNK
ncbi:oligosaccharide flippase family protein [Limosilactobacillus vaginalis]|uniref:oligosaccharide flippase family protein n=1 Tax=Limosilactobacillus vaginalis TaxID=1633 RepID=UPI0025A47099|nr:oligosaccharide flippase family protein [Limosilactobacillus vaginalis]MDM8260098.1 oligosaccharide flippase family protein [Limosilactobacillus vaginalis]